MSVARGAPSGSKEFGLTSQDMERDELTEKPMDADEEEDDEKHGGEPSEANSDVEDQKHSRKMSCTSIGSTDINDEEDGGDDEDDEEKRKVLLGPQIALKEQLEMDKVCV